MKLFTNFTSLIKKFLALTYPMKPSSSACWHRKAPFLCSVSLLYITSRLTSLHTLGGRCSGFSIPDLAFLPGVWSRWSRTPPPGGRWEPAQCMLMSARRCSLIGWREFQLLCMSAGARESRGAAGSILGPARSAFCASRSTPRLGRIRLACELGGSPFRSHSCCGREFIQGPE